MIEAMWSSVIAPLRNFRELTGRKLNPADHDAANGHDSSIHHALRNVSFEVSEGEVLGIIGHNGAGKSTLLKIMSRITEPSSGRAVLKGRVSSLLEVGTGFHQELSGRDNVYMNGTILGMSRQEITRKFDEIVAFSGVETFVDTPVKFYSSGMKVRLAFAVAAHMDPEILIIDEVLAVGDLAFQEKCLSKMEDVSSSGRTILFVSHNMVAVEGLCNRCMLLNGGEMEYIGTVEEAISRYRQSSLTQSVGVDLGQRTDREGGGLVKFTRITCNNGGEVKAGESLRLMIEFEATGKVDHLQIAVKISRNYREVVLCLDNRLMGIKLSAKRGINRVEVILPRLDLMPNKYLIDLWAGSGTIAEDRIFNAATLNVLERDVYGSGILPRANKHGLIIPPKCHWTNQSL